MDEHNQIDHFKISELVDAYQLDITPAELHGLVTGSVCVQAFNPVDQQWLKLIMPYKTLNEHDKEDLGNNLKIYYDATLQELDGHMFEFSLALPDEDSHADYRTQELASWCRGFLTAYRQLLKTDDALSDDASEALEDLNEIANAITGDGEQEEFEQALAELEEYLRISIQMIFDDLNPTQTLH